MANQSDAIAALDVKIDVVEDELVAVGLPRALELQHHAAAFWRRRKLEMNALALGWDLEPLDFFEHLDAALHLRSLGRLVAEAVDELFDPLNLLVLALLRIAQPLEGRVPLLEVLRVVGVVLGDSAQGEI